MKHTGQHAALDLCWRCDLYRQDLAFLRQVRSLAGTARMAREEAEQYAGDIHDPELRRQAEAELERE